MNVRKSQRGFSMIELTIVVAVILIIIAIALPIMGRTIENYRLDASGHSVASLIQQTRILAAKTNTPYYAQYNTAVTPNMIYANTDQSAFAIGNPDVYLSTNVSFQSSGLPDHSQLDALMSNGNAGAVGTFPTTSAPAPPIGFNARGLPCTQGASVSICTQSSSAAQYFEWFMQDSATGGWEAVTVTPAGRVKAYRLSGTSGCGYSACWQ